MSTDGCTVSLAVAWDQERLGESRVVPVKVEQNLKENKVQQSLEFSLDLAATISDFMKQYKCDEDEMDDYSDEEDSEERPQKKVEEEVEEKTATDDGGDVVSLLIRGMRGNIKTKFWKPFASVLLDMAEDSKNKYLLVTLMSFLLQTRGNIALQLDRQ